MSPTEWARERAQRLVARMPQMLLYGEVASYGHPGAWADCIEAALLDAMRVQREADAAICGEIAEGYARQYREDHDERALTALSGAEACEDAIRQAGGGEG